MIGLISVCELESKSSSLKKHGYMYLNKALFLVLIIFIISCQCTWTQIHSARTFNYKKSYSQPIVYNISNDMLSEKIAAIYDKRLFK